MRDSHCMIIHDICKVIGGKAIPLDYNEVVLLFGSAISSIDQISHLGPPGTLESNTMRLTVGSAAVRLSGRYVTTLAIVVAMATAFWAVLHIVALEGVQVFWCTKATVCPA